MVNIHEMYVSADFFEEILNIDNTKSPHSTDSERKAEQNENLNSQVRSKPGPKPGTGGRPKKMINFYLG
jgi:hypothetical protein